MNYKRFHFDFFFFFDAVRKLKKTYKFMQNSTSKYEINR